MNKKILKDSIKKAYSSIAKKKMNSLPFLCCSSTNTNETIALKIGYIDEEIKSAPKESNQGLGCGAPVSDKIIKKGDTVLDLGSGAGFDTFLASRLVGETGKVIGVDFSEDMVSKATAIATANGYKNVNFKLGDIEKLPIESNSINVVISNCVINLSQNKQKVFNEAYRVMSNDGIFLVSDILLLEELPKFIKNSLPHHIACVAGAIGKEEYISLMQNSGFKDIIIQSEQSVPLELVLSDPILSSMVTDNNIPKEFIKKIVKSIVSIKFLAIK